MKMSDIAQILDCRVLCCADQMDNDVYSACGSDMMSDVLAYVKNQAVLLTGLLNTQVIRTAEMMDMLCVVFVRNKMPSQEILRAAEDSGIVVMTTRHRMYEACGMLYAGGLNRCEGDDRE
ncbi:MAG: hypothetical protein ILO68_05055 [Clostridia bacterium]|nr:hypothetical protein [Clostridia bacterium]